MMRHAMYLLVLLMACSCVVAPRSAGADSIPYDREDIRSALGIDDLPADAPVHAGFVPEVGDFTVPVHSLGRFDYGAAAVALSSSGSRIEYDLSSDEAGETGLGITVVVGDTVQVARDSFVSSLHEYSAGRGTPWHAADYGFVGGDASAVWVYENQPYILQVLVRNVVLTISSTLPSDFADVRNSMTNMVDRLLESPSYPEMPDEARPRIVRLELGHEVYLRQHDARASQRVEIDLAADDLDDLFFAFEASGNGHTGRYDPAYDEGKDGWFYDPDVAGPATLTVIVCNEMGVIATRTLEFTIHEGPPPDDDEDEDEGDEE